jgi:hypothetical protein
MELPIGNRHHAGQDERDWSGSEAKHDCDPAKELQYPADTRLGKKGRGAGLTGDSAKPAEQDQAPSLDE